MNKHAIALLNQPELILTDHPIFPIISLSLPHIVTIGSWVRSLLTSFWVNLRHVTVSLQQNVIQSVSLVLSQRVWINT
jgi:hypothetical protein